MNKHFILAAAVLLGLISIDALAAAAPSIYPGKLIALGTMEDSRQMTVADFNGDGRMDIATPDYPGAAWVFLAEEDGGYAAPKSYASHGAAWTIASGDLNGDGYPDIVTGSNNTRRELSVLLNNGDGTFSAYTDYTYSGGGYDSAGALAVGDADGDGAADVVVGSHAGAEIYVVPGNGDGTLNESGVQTLATAASEHHGMSIADMNGDGMADIVAASGCSGSSGSVDVFLGAADGVFSASPDKSVYASSCPGSAVADVNEDGVPDVVVVSREYSNVKVMFGDGAGGFLADYGYYSLPDGSLAKWARVGDVDGDGHLDIFEPNATTYVASVLYGKGDGTFEEAVLVPMGETSDIAAVDTNGDGALDLVGLDDDGTIVIIKSLGDRRFLSYGSYTYQMRYGQGEGAIDMVSADFNGDGAPDLATLNGGDTSMTSDGDETISVLLNDGQGGFGEPQVAEFGATSYMHALTTADFDADGNMDVATGDGSGILWVGLGKGDGTFEFSAGATLASTSLKGLAAGDVDHDGHADIVVSDSTNGQVQICMGGGSGTFDCSASIAAGSPMRAKLSDLDGDGNLDLFVISYGADLANYGIYVFLGDGTGAFGDGNGVAVPAAALHVGNRLDNFSSAGVGDVNGDGVPDLAVGASSYNFVSVFVGNGDGTFADAVTYPTTTRGGNTVLADVNADGNADVVTGTLYGAELNVLFNNGDGTFGKPIVLAANYQPVALLVLDVDSDGLLDIMAASRAGADSPSYKTTVAVYRHNHAPVVTGAALVVNENTSGNGQLRAVDVDQDSFGFAAATPPAHGELELDAKTGAYTYTPATGYSGGDSFTVTASDGLNTSVPIAVSITVKPTATADDDAGDGDTSGNDAGDGDTTGGDTTGGDSGTGGSGNTNDPLPSSSIGGGGALGFLGFGLLGLPLLRRRRRV